MQELLATLESFITAGVDEIIQDTPRNFTKKANTPTKTPVIKMDNLVAELKPTVNTISQSRELANKASNLDELKEIIENFSGCELHKTAKSTVFADGNRESDILLIGEAPGASEDEQGIPFCGISGQLLDDIFKSIGRKRADNLYITNSVFWRPPGNRRPTDEEIAICRPFVEKHIALQNPKIIILVGSTAMACLLPNITETISKVRGEIYKYKNEYLKEEIDITPIFHPSYLLRQPAKKKVMWEDMLNIRKHIS